MAQVLAARPWAAWVRAAGLAWWPIDTLLSAYLAGVGLLVFWNRARVPMAGALLALHAAGLALILLAAWADRFRTSPAVWVFRHWYPLPYLAACYREMAILIPAVRRVDFDAVMARLDLALWGVYPSLWVERLYRAWLTELLQLAYALFFAAVLGVAWLLWRRGRLEEFRYYAFLLSLGFLSSYLGYFLVPVRGPRFWLAPVERVPLEGLWLFSGVRGLLDRLESSHWDCFPSGHVAMTLLACWAARRISPGLGWVYGLYAACTLLATVYLRYHYTVDLLAGGLLAAAVLVAAPRLCGRPQKGG